ncbi:MAG: hypothetical protein JW395_4164 [Nitrospira sp.]|nr:hypothetical protein [Nitrospira sp.]
MSQQTKSTVTKPPATAVKELARSKVETKQPSATKPGASGTRPVSTPGPKQTSQPSTSKQDRVVAMLRQPAGSTVAAVMKATGWQKHSVHGFLAGVVRKKLRLNLLSEKKGDARVYRIAERKPGKAAPRDRKRSAR